MDFFGTDIYEKGAGILPSPVPSFKAFALPTCRERTTQKAHADMYTTRPSSADGRNGTWIYTPRGRHWLPSVLPTGQKLRSFETRKPDACKRLLHIICTYSSPTLGPSVELCATNIQKKLCGRGFHAFFSASLFLFVKGMPWLLCDASFCRRWNVAGTSVPENREKPVAMRVLWNSVGRGRPAVRSISLTNRACRGDQNAETN